MVGALALAGGWAGLAWSARLPRSAEERIRQALAAGLEEAGSLEVRVEARPGWRVLAGSIDRLEIEGRGLRSGELVADRLSVVGEAIQLDMARLAGARQLAVSSAGRLDLEMTLSEDALNRFLQATNDLARLLHVQLLPEGARLLLDAELQGQRVRIALNSQLQVQPGNVVAVIPDRLAIEQNGGEALALDLAGGNTPLAVQLGALPVPVELDRVTVAEGELHLFASYHGGS